jgi:hypothetical protein
VTLIQIFRLGISCSLSLGEVVFLIGRRQKATPALTPLFYEVFAFKGVKRIRSPCGPTEVGAVMSFALFTLPHGILRT